MSLAAGSVIDAGLEGTVRAAASAGFDAVGLRPDPRRCTPAAARALGVMAADLGLVVLDVEVARLGQEVRPGDNLRLVDLAHEMRAAYVLAVSHQVEAGTAEVALAALADHAAAGGTAVALEFMAFTAVPDLRSAVELADGAGRSNIRILVDALHLQRSGGKPADVSDLAPVLLGYLQLCDGPLDGPRTTAGLADEARGRRVAPGTGELALTELLGAVPPGTPLSVEVQSVELTHRFDPETRARYLFRRTHEILASPAATASPPAHDTRTDV